MKGLRVEQDGACLESVAKKTTAIKLLARAGEVEVMLQTVKAAKPFSLTPWQGFEFAFITDGTLIWDDNGKEVTLSKGDYIVATNLVQTAYFRTVTDVTFMYVASPPVFGFVSENIKQWLDLARDIEVKDMYTEEHCKRIERLSTRIGEKLRLSGGQMVRLVDAAYLHDLGKTAIPEEVLTKPTKLSEEEWELIRRHPTEGRQILQDTFISEVGYIIEQHHEREDGKGYPLGLEGREISIEAKIIAVADAYDAMTSDRPYRKALTEQQAIEEIIRQRGAQFSPEVVDAFMEIMREDGKLPRE